MGQKTHYHYDARDNLSALTHPAGTRRWMHNDQGQVTQATDERGGISRYRWRTDGQLIEWTDCSQRSTHWQYDDTHPLTSSHYTQVPPVNLST